MWLLLILAAIILMRRGMLSEMFAIMWLTLAVIMLLGTVWPRFLKPVAFCVQGQYPLLFLVSLVVFLCLILLYLSVKVTILSEKVVRLAQELALLNLREGDGGENKKN